MQTMLADAVEASDAAGFGPKNVHFVSFGAL